MCVGVPAKIIELEEERALVDVLGSKMYVGIIFVPNVMIGDFVLLHAGQAMSIIEESFAEESLKEWRDILNAAD
ncbi:Ni-Fe hydrogenase maturation protein HypC [Alkalihalophilus pseudofirmus OF4]|uniref:Ni-Fe hydrogenase maturation protein HypC n=1 Tax=Alkalihalophilus pseudofirmus (strain ATCC BAA-2126 / JCM 17055 / OF4) TaxID=398511 RepID=D3FUD0_ALKPO|nr:MULTISPECIES: HypC/HybG/HupF family hydrogenase formation chaperone [Alkalihalophilus]ADC48332.1 Ni-Fe hydrogenase maturation protein HypC [Alkalihalophilus pseudofirmus OF4]MED1601166.1 HypC/HybG/HupF family hydrogenase formation chaperone [Alkalihalophilus marmarensis]